MATNDFLAFAQGGGANVETQSAYAADPLLSIGNQPGVAISAFNNKAIRQANAVTSQFAQFLANQTGADIKDDTVQARLLAQIAAALQPISHVYTKFLSGSGTFNNTYYFFIASGNATAAATYTNNSKTFTVSATIAAGTLLQTTGTGAPTVSGTLTKTSGSGDATLTFYAMRACSFMTVRACGGGGGGSGSANSSHSGSTGGTGGTTTFGSTLLSLVGGNGGTGGGSSAGAGGVGGAPTVTAPAIAEFSYNGKSGNCSYFAQSGATPPGAGGGGGSSLFSGGGSLNIGSSVGEDGIANTGSGGQGGCLSSATTNASGGGGGGGGAYASVYISAPASNYAYAVGGSGTAGTAGTGGQNGGAGASGAIYIVEMF